MIAALVAGLVGVAVALTLPAREPRGPRLEAREVPPAAPLLLRWRPLLCAGAAMRAMIAQQPSGGRIINNGSISAHVPRPLSVAYTVTKHAMTGLTRSIDLDGRPYGISAGQIDIGNARTSIMTELGVGSGTLQPDGSRRVEPTFDVADAARAVLFMAQLPAEANVSSLTVAASGMPFGGRG